MITGKTLVELGYTPGKWFAKAIAFANNQGLEGDELSAFLTHVCPAPPIEPFKEPIAFIENIICETEDEIKNLEAYKAGHVDGYELGKHYEDEIYPNSSYYTQTFKSDE